MEDSVPCILFVRLAGAEPLSDLDRTRLVRLFYCATAPKFMYKTHDKWAAITSKTDDDSNVVGLAAPLINVTHEVMTSVAKSYLQEATKYNFFGDREITLVPRAEQEKPKGANGWTMPFLYEGVSNANAPAESVDGVRWLGRQKVKRNRKGEAYGGDDMNPYLIWDEGEYSTYPVAKTIVPGKKVINRVMTELEIIVDASPTTVPYADVLSTPKGTYDFEAYTKLFLDLLNRIKATKTDSTTVWVDVIRASASLRDRSILSSVELALTEVLGKVKRNEMGLSHEGVEEKYRQTNKQLFRGNIYVNFETLMEHLELLDDESYLIWKTQWLNEALDMIYNKLKPQIAGLALVAARYLRGTVFHDASVGFHGVWFTYDEGKKRWFKRKPDAGSLLELIGIVESKVNAIAKDPAQSQENNAVLKACVDIVQTETGREKLLKEMKSIVKVDSFSEIADKNYDMIPFMNYCVEVIKVGGKNTVTVRKHKKQDFTTKVIPIEYEGELSWKSPKVVAVMDFFRKFITDDESREFVLYWCGSSLWRGNRDRCILQIKGGGGNAKTTFMTILERLHSLVVKIKASAFYAYEKQAGAADTEFMAMKGAAIAAVEEIEPGKTGRTTVAKNLSGGGKLPLRAIFQAEEIVDSTAKLLFIGQNLLHWPDDQAMRDRLHNVNVESRFSDSAPADEATQWKERHFPKDPEFITKVPEMDEAILWIFVEYLKKYIALGRLPKAAKITKDTETYWEEHNIYKQFIEANYTIDPTCYVLQNDLFDVAHHYFARHPASREWKREGLLDYIKCQWGIYGSGNEVGYDTAKCVIKGFAAKGK